MKQILPIILLVLILGPAAKKVLRPDPPPPPPVEARRPAPPPPPPPASPAEWFATVRPRCTPADVRLTTDLNPPPAGAAGDAYEAACFALAGDIPTARARLLGLPEADRVDGVTVIYDVARAVADEGHLGRSGPLMELVLEFWPNHYLALFEAGQARYATGDKQGAQRFFADFLAIYRNEDTLASSARRMMSGMAER